MKKPCPLTIILTLIVTQFNVSKVPAQANAMKLPQPVFYQLTQKDKQDYTLVAGQPLKIKRDTFVYQLTPNDFGVKLEKQDYAIIPVTFTNNATDTLEYVGMSCSWWDIYETDNSQVTILQPNVKCYKNGEIIIKVAPKASSVVNLTILVTKKLSETATFRIGMILQKYVGEKQPGYSNMFQENNIIWTNEVEVL